MFFLKEFSNHEGFLEQIAGDQYYIPNVSVCGEEGTETDVHYSPTFDKLIAVYKVDADNTEITVINGVWISQTKEAPAHMTYEFEEDFMLDGKPMNVSELSYEPMRNLVATSTPMPLKTTLNKGIHVAEFTLRDIEALSYEGDAYYMKSTFMSFVNNQDVRKLFFENDSDVCASPLCAGLECVYIPESAFAHNYMDSGAEDSPFYGCTGIKAMVFMGHPQPLNEISMGVHFLLDYNNDTNTMTMVGEDVYGYVDPKYVDELNNTMNSFITSVSGYGTQVVNNKTTWFKPMYELIPQEIRDIVQG